MVRPLEEVFPALAGVDPGYDNRNDLTSLTRYADVAGTQLLGTTVYNYDAAGGLTSIVNDIQGRNGFFRRLSQA